MLGIAAALPAPVCAAGLTVVLVDHLTLGELLSGRNPPIEPRAVNGSVLALISPGLPRGSDPAANLYATLSAGDVVSVSNPHAGLLQRELASSGAAADVTFIRFGPIDSATQSTALRNLINRLRKSRRVGRAPGVLVVGVSPPMIGREWDSLTPIVWLSCGGDTTDAAMQPTLTSDTTQTSGLIALRDVAPTILSAEGIAIPDSMSGHPARLIELGPGVSRDEALRSIDRVTRLGQQSVALFGWLFGLGGGSCLLLSMWCVIKRRQPVLLRYMLRFFLAVPLALMAAGLAPPTTTAAYVAEIAGICAILAFAPNLTLLLVLSGAAIIVDGIRGAPAVSRSLISDYWLSGIRFYGIGNEYMGVLIGFALVAPFVGKPRSWTPVRLTVLAAWFLLVVFVLAYPQFGAKAGGSVTSMAAFLPCWWAIARRSRPSFAAWLCGVLSGFLAIFAFSALAHHFGGRQTHIQAATSAVAHGRLGYIEHVALRKAKMAVKVALAPGALGGIVGVAIVYAIWLRSALAMRVAEFLDGRSDLRTALTAGLWGMLAALLFNDSGAVAALLLFGVLGLSLLHEMLGQLCESSPSMSEMSESVSPSATNSSSAPIRSSL